MEEKKQYKLDKIAGPSASFAGYIFFVTGLATVYFSFTALFLVALGAALSFSYNRLSLNPVGHIYSSQIMLFGFIPIGKWQTIQKDNALVVQHFKGNHSASSLSNRISSTAVDDSRIYLTHADRKSNVLFAVFKTEEEAKAELAVLNNLLNRQ